MIVKDIDINILIPYQNNPRKNEIAIDKTAVSIKEYGWRQPIVVDKDMVIIAGHTRLEAAKRLDFETVPVHIAEGLSDAQVKAYRLADNRVGQEADWDIGLLKSELEDLSSLDFDLSLTGFDDYEINEYIKNMNFQPASAEDQGQLDKIEPIFVNCPHCGKEFNIKDA